MTPSDDWPPSGPETVGASGQAVAPDHHRLPVGETGLGASDGGRGATRSSSRAGATRSKAPQTPPATAARRSTTPTRCRRCGAPTLTGLDDERAAFTATVDPTVLTRTGELLAVVAGWTTYEHDASGGLWRRDPWRLRSTARGHVHPAHRCALPIPAAWTAPTPTAADVTHGDTPSF